MNNHSERQREILRKIGVEVWKSRVVEVAESAPLETPAEEPQSTARAAAEPLPAADIAETTDDVGVVESVAEAADESLAPIQQQVSACRKCELHKTRTNTVFGCGSADADWLLVGEAPGEHEDLQGQPFVGRAGKLLDLMIAALGMTREQVFIANVLKCRPPDNRDPSPSEIEQCEPYLHRQLALIQPKVIVALGKISAQALLKSTQPLGKLRGQTHHYGAANIPLIATYHPAYLLRSPHHKAEAWLDLWQAKTIVEQHPARPSPPVDAPASG